MKIVLVDDSLDVQRSFGNLLESVPGAAVAGSARDVTGAISVIDSIHPDVVVLDANLLDGDRGIDVLRYVKRHRPRTEVIVLSDFASARLRESYEDAGASAIFDKATQFIQARDWIAALSAVPLNQPSPGAGSTGASPLSMP